ncbi:MAG: MCE family protein [Phycisphaeraceae bacterium]|nr:MCE family protein [Phycisphaeraceae bacterium]
MPRTYKRNNILAGLFLLASICLALVVSIVLSDLSLTPSKAYVVRFELREGATGLKPGSKVNIGGLEVGKVVSIGFAKDESNRPIGVDVRIKVRADLALYDDAVAYLDLPLLGTLSTINIPHAGGHSAGASVLRPEGVLTGTLAPPAFLAQAGFGPAERERVQRVLASIDHVVTHFNDMVDRYDPLVTDALIDAQESLREVRGLVADLAARTPEWSDRVDRSLGDLNALTSGLRPAGAKAGEMMDEVRAGIDDARRVVSTVQETIDEQRPGIERIVTNVEAATADFQREMMPAAQRAVSQFEQRASAAGELIEQIRQLLDEQTPSLRRTFANLRLTSEQLKLVATEIRAQPWRLLIRPTTKELESQLVYDAARAYAVSVSDLRAAGEALQIALDRADPARPISREEIERLQSELEARFESTRQAEREFLQRLMRQR